MENRICVIMLTYNRFQYIERSISSLYKRAGQEFDLYVFDDCSDLDVQNQLKLLRDKYNFKLYINNKNLGIYRNFYFNLKYIPRDYDYYVKLDSDIEILSDEFFPNILEVFSYPEKLGGIASRVEGIRNVDRYDSSIDFFNGHVIKIDCPVVYGCCFVFPKIMFDSFKRLTDIEIMRDEEKWGIDSILYKHSLTIGKFLIVEDVSVFHIDNTYGQRRVNSDYFSERSRWSKIDVDEVWYIKASKILSPNHIARPVYQKIKEISSTFEIFLENCSRYIKDNSVLKNIDLEKIEIKQKIITDKNNMKTIFKITSPLNFSPDKNIKQGDSVYFSSVPVWAKNNPNVVIEKELVSDSDYDMFLNPEKTVATAEESSEVETAPIIEEKEETIYKEPEIMNEEAIAPELLKETIEEEKEKIPQVVKKHRGRPSNKKNKK